MCKLLGCPGLNAPFIIPDEPKLSCINVILYLRASLVAQTVKNLTAMQETWVWSLGWEDHLGEEMATYSGILAWRIPWTEEPGGLQSTGSQRVWHNWATNTHTHTHTHTHKIGWDRCQSLESQTESFVYWIQSCDKTRICWGFSKDFLGYNKRTN